MRSAPKMILIAAMLSLASACASSIQVHAPVEGCSTLVAERWTQPTPSAVLGETGDATLDWQLFGVAQTGQLNIANADKAAVLETVRRCEARDAAAIREVERPWWRLWPPRPREPG